MAKKKINKHLIDSFDKLFNVATPENIDVLSIDLLNWFITSHDIIEHLRRKFPNETKNKTNSEIVKCAFIWDDDGKNDFLGVEIHKEKTK